MGLYDERLIRISTPLGGIEFIVTAFTGTEQISQLFRFNIQLATNSSGGDKVTFEQLAGKKVTIGIKTGSEERFFNGIVTAFSPSLTSQIEGFSTYDAVIRPTFWMHTEYHDCRIFQEKSVDQIIKEVLQEPSPGGGSGSPAGGRGPPPLR